MESKNNFRREKAIRLSLYRMFVKYKPEYASEHGAYNGGVKYYYTYLTKTGTGLEELCRMIADNKHRGHFLFAFLYNNQQRDGEVLRAWDKYANELSQKEVGNLNHRLRMKKRNRNKQKHK